jgi:hypothetical protein
MSTLNDQQDRAIGRAFLLAQNAPFAPMGRTFARIVTPPTTKWGIQPVYPDEKDFCKNCNTPQRVQPPPISFKDSGYA